MSIVNTIVIAAIAIIVYVKFNSTIRPWINDIKDTIESLKDINDRTQELQTRVDELQSYQDATLGYSVNGFTCNSGICSSASTTLSEDVSQLQSLYKSESQCSNVCGV
jgi:hypothetical protein